jgi:tetratricopeptide (TPR) repeat protein
VIERVLAKACGIEFDDKHTPAMLLERMRSEVALVETVDEATIRHRSDVRRLMLPLLRRKLGPIAAEIDEAAVAYWRDVPGAAARAEEIYHRLWLGQLGPEIELRWMAGAAQFLDDALDEFAAIAPNTLCHFWLAKRLERELPEETRKTADQLTWEWDTKHKARTLMASGRFSEVVSVIRQRPADQRSPASELWLIEIESLLLLGQPLEAGVVADRALRRAAMVDDSGYLHALLSQKTVIEERRDRTEAAMDLARQAAALAEDMKDPVRVFLSNVTLARLLRQAGSAGREERGAIHKRLGGLLANRQVWQMLLQRPPMMREAAAEIGADHPNLLVYALERVGLWSTGGTTRLPSMFQGMAGGHPFTFAVVNRVPRLEGRHLEQARDFEHTLAMLLAAGDADELLKIEVSELFAEAVDRIIRNPIG